MQRHSLSLTWATLCLLLFCGMAHASAPDYEAQYSALLESLSGSLDDKNTAQALVDRSDALYKQIRQYRRENRKALAPEQSDALRGLYREVRDFKSFVRVVAQLHNAADIDIGKFDAVSKRLGLEPRVLQTHDATGLELVRLDVGSFGSILLRNRSRTTYTLMYSSNDPERSGGIGNAMCENYSVLSGLFNSRDREIEDIVLTLNPTALNVSACD